MAAAAVVRRLRGVNAPPGMQMIFQGKVDYLREIADQLKAAGIRTASGPLPGSG